MAIQTIILPKMLPRDRAICRIVDALEDLPISEGFRVEIHQHKSTRSDLQNRTLWWIYGTILKVGGELTGGYEKEDLHEFFLEKHFGEVKFTLFGSERHKPMRRSSRLSKMEFAEFVDFIYRFMASQGVALPTPDPEYAEHREASAA